MATPRSRRPSLADRLTSSDQVFAGQSTDYRFAYLDLDAIEANPENARRRFDEAALEELAASIRRHGVIQPVTVQPSGEKSYRLVAGERRYRASRLAGKQRIPAVIREQGQAGAMSLIENLQREDLNPIEEALGVQHLIDAEGITQQDAARQLGRSNAYVSQMLSLLVLDEEIKSAVLDGRAVSKSQLLELAGQAPAEQRRLWELVRDGATVRALREAKQGRLGKTGGGIPYFEQVVRRLDTLDRQMEGKSDAERARLRAELEDVRSAIDVFLERHA